MKKRLIAAVAALVLVAAGGAAAWRVGAVRTQAQLEATLAAMAASGVRIGHARSTVSGFPFRYAMRLEDVVAAAPGGAWRLNLPWLETEVSLFSPDVVVSRPSPTATLALGSRPELGFGPAPVTARLYARNMVIETRLDGGWAGSVVSADSLSADLAGPGGAVGARLVLDAVAGGAEAAQGGLTRVRLAADSLHVATAVFDLELAAPAFEGDGAGFGAGSTDAFVNAGGVARGALAWEALRLTGARVEIAGDAAPLSTETGPTAMSMVIEDGRAAFGASFDDVELGLGAPLNGRAGATRAEARFEMPVTTAPLPQPYALDLVLDAVALDEAIWSALDAEGRAVRQTMAARLRIGGLARMLRGLDGLAAAGAPPVAISTMEVEEAALDGFGGTFRAVGGFAMDGAPGGPEGAFTVSATAWREMIGGLTAIGVLDAPRAAAVAAFAEAVHPGEGDPSRLSSEIVFGGGVVTADGRRIR
ncbi:MAG: DUF2125 domain-containing protein [Rhodobacteraceae bacterium]|nr:MAG: DUF2125 domain-containing protein [Paracoccaceae bacterium]